VSHANATIGGALREAIRCYLGRSYIPPRKRRGFLPVKREQSVVAVTTVTPSEPLVMRASPEPPFQAGKRRA
jgi:hypothetical protein